MLVVVTGNRMNIVSDLKSIESDSIDYLSLEREMKKITLLTIFIMNLFIGNSFAVCPPPPQYVAGTAYQAGDIVMNQTSEGDFFVCDVADWCSSNAAWAYEPGVGVHWLMAWTNVNVIACGGSSGGSSSGGGSNNVKPTIILNVPPNFNDALGGHPVPISIHASDPDGTIVQWELVASLNTIDGFKFPVVVDSGSSTGGAVGEMHHFSAEWLPLHRENGLTAKVTDNNGAISITSKVVFALPHTPTGSPPVIGPLVVPSTAVEGQAVHISGPISDPDGETTGFLVFVDGVKQSTLSIPSVGGQVDWTWIATLGTHEIRVLAHDSYYPYFSVAVSMIHVTENTTGVCIGLPSWDAASVYLASDEVRHNGNKYQANWWSQGQDPFTNSGPWQVWTLLEPCT